MHILCICIYRVPMHSPSRGS